MRLMTVLTVFGEKKRTRSIETQRRFMSPLNIKKDLIERKLGQLTGGQLIEASCYETKKSKKFGISEKVLNTSCPFYIPTVDEGQCH